MNLLQKRRSVSLLLSPVVFSAFVPGIASSRGPTNVVNTSPGDIYSSITQQRMRDIVLKTPTAAGAMNATLDYVTGVKLKPRNIDPPSSPPPAPPSSSSLSCAGPTAGEPVPLPPQAAVRYIRPGRCGGQVQTQRVRQRRQCLPLLHFSALNRRWRSRPVHHPTPASPHPVDVQPGVRAI